MDEAQANELVAERFSRMMNATTSPLGVAGDPPVTAAATAVLLVAYLAARRSDAPEGLQKQRLLGGRIGGMLAVQRLGGPVRAVRADPNPRDVAFAPAELTEGVAQLVRAELGFLLRRVGRWFRFTVLRIRIRIGWVGFLPNQRQRVACLRGLRSPREPRRIEASRSRAFRGRFGSFHFIGHLNTPSRNQVAHLERQQTQGQLGERLNRRAVVFPRAVPVACADFKVQMRP